MTETTDLHGVDQDATASAEHHQPPLWPSLTVIGLGGTAAAFLVTVEPGSSSPLAALYVQCPSLTLFGVLCPLCGGTRAARALVSGDLRAVAGFNLVLPVLIVLGAWAWLASITAGARAPVPPVPRTRRLWVSLGAATVLYAVLRNLPWEPFTWLAP